ncbi:hypothetical protein BDP55DRAFT_728824 [Colletotrichum godetiae]|uniref:C2H2-type domain-containing protein n=1 Tax=Colletotrichum godetiae TaxID=1209918 RepID=A0AAJ0AKF9_9PEZI|nr:uncharacterized protein BDP55DRAFT_728824 [Colletotrichum godetiae]KAK1675529.1 hypothetical protein BDP55DRAFT_728824 [Colletotrichum godetiae]
MSFSIRHYLAAGIRGMRVAAGLSHDDIFDQMFEALNILRQQAAQNGDIQPYLEDYGLDDIYGPPSPEYINLTDVPGHSSRSHGVNSNNNPGPAQPGNQVDMPIRLSATPQPFETPQLGAAPPPSAVVQPTVYATDPHAPIPAVHRPPPEPVMNPFTLMPRKKGDKRDNLWPCEYIGCDSSYTRRYTVIEHMVTVHGMPAKPKRLQRPRNPANPIASGSGEAQASSSSSTSQIQPAGPPGAATQDDEDADMEE